MRKILLYALLGVVGLAIAGLLRQRQRPIPIPPPLSFLFENPLVEAFAGSELLVERLDLAPGMRVLDAGCGPGRLTIPLARAVEPSGEVVALDSQRAMLEKLEHRLEVESITNVRALEAALGEGALERVTFDRVLLTFVLGSLPTAAPSVERSTLLVVTRPQLLRLLRAEDQVAEALLRTLGAMVRRTTRQISDLAFLSLQGRVAAKLLDLTGPDGSRTRRITQVELATMVGGARQTVNQALRSLESRGYIRSTGRVFEILDREQLRRLAGG